MDQNEHQTAEQRQARHFLKTFLKAASTYDYEAIEQLRRLLAVSRYRKSLKSGRPIPEEAAVPQTGEVEKWLTRLDDRDQELLSEIQELLCGFDEDQDKGSKP